MVKSILFLDIDGVLNSIAYAIREQPRGLWGIDRQAIPLLQQIIDRSGCVVVLMSTWRNLYPLSEMARRLHEHGMREEVPLIGATPNFGMGDGRGLRGYEVEHWLSHLTQIPPYVCLDDDSDFLPEQPLVQTDIQVGLTPADVWRCVHILNGDK